MNDEILWEHKPSGIPAIEVRIWMKRTEEGGRRLPFWRNYCPHLMVKGRETMWGVRVLAVTHSPRPNAAFPGDEVSLVCALMYYAPEFDYKDLRGRATFEMKEGSRVIGTGVVMSDFEW